MFGAKLGIGPPTQLKLVITSVIVSGLFARGTGSILIDMVSGCSRFIKHHKLIPDQNLVDSREKF
jgi:hypothetical protein